MLLLSPSLSLFCSSFPSTTLLPLQLGPLPTMTSTARSSAPCHVWFQLLPIITSSSRSWPPATSSTPTVLLIYRPSKCTNCTVSIIAVLRTRAFFRATAMDLGAHRWLDSRSWVLTPVCATISVKLLGAMGKPPWISCATKPYTSRYRTISSPNQCDSSIIPSGRKLEVVQALESWYADWSIPWRGFIDDWNSVAFRCFIRW